MNQLTLYLEMTGIPEVAAMNFLQNHGIISDNCITAEQVGDAGAAISYLNLNYTTKHTKPK
jgi:hypothetical protein